MKTSNSKTKVHAFLGAAFMLLIAVLFTACIYRQNLHGKRGKLYDEKDSRGNRQERGTPRYSGTQRCT